MHVRYQGANMVLIKALFLVAERGSKLIHDPFKGASFIHEGYILMASANANYLPKALPPKIIIFGDGVSIYEFWRMQTVNNLLIQHII